MTSGKRFLQSVFLYTIVSFLPALFRFFIFPVYVKILSPADYGLLALHGSLVAILAPIIALGIDASYSRCYFDFNKTSRQIQRYLSVTLTLLFLVEAFFSLILFLAGPYLFPFLIKGNDFPFYPFGTLAIAYAVTAVFKAIIGFYFRNRNIPLAYALFFVFALSFSTLGELYAMFFVAPKAENLLFARVLGEGTVVLITLILMIIKLQLKPLWIWKPYLKETFKFALPMIPYMILILLYMNIDKIIVKNQISTEMLGVYNVAFTIAFLTETFLQALDNATAADIFNFWNQNKLFHVNKILSFFNWAITGIVSISIPAGFLFILYFADEDFFQAYKILPVLTTAVILRTFTTILMKPVYYYKKHKWLFLGNLAALITLILANYLLIPPFGIWGAAISIPLTRLAKMITTYVIYRINRKYYPEFSLQFGKIQFFSLLIFLWLLALGFVNYLRISISFVDEFFLYLIGFLLFLLLSRDIFKKLYVMLRRKRFKLSELFSYF